MQPKRYSDWRAERGVEDLGDELLTLVLILEPWTEEVV